MYFFYLDREDTSTRITSTPRSTRKRGLEKTPKVATNTVPSSPEVFKQSLLSEGNTNSNPTNSTSSPCIISPTSNKENEVMKRKSISSNSNNSTPSSFQKDSKKTPSADDQKQNKSILTRNSAKKELISKMIMTRKRLSQENLTIQSTYSKSNKSITGKSRIPVRSQKIDKQADNNSIEKKGISKKSRLLSGKIPVGRSMRLKINAASTTTISGAITSLASDKFTRRRNV